MHIFISHSTKDGAREALQLVTALERAGHRCWIAPRDVKAGVTYPGQVVAAIERSKGLVLLLTPGANESPDVLQEVQLASTARKTIAPVMVRATSPAADLRYYVGVRHQIAWSERGIVVAALTEAFGAGALPAPPVAGRQHRVARDIRGINVATVRAHLAAQPGVIAVHDLQVWATKNAVMLTAQLVRPEGSDDAFLSNLRESLVLRFGIIQATIQVTRSAPED
ncbi:MAG: TIR domain-containing protein [Caulobacteraceae bacterium]